MASRDHRDSRRRRISSACFLYSSTAAVTFVSRARLSAWRGTSVTAVQSKATIELRTQTGNRYRRRGETRLSRSLAGVAAKGERAWLFKVGVKPDRYVRLRVSRRLSRSTVAHRKPIHTGAKKAGGKTKHVQQYVNRGARSFLVVFARFFALHLTSKLINRTCTFRGSLRR